MKLTKLTVLVAVVLAAGAVSGCTVGLSGAGSSTRSAVVFAAVEPVDGQLSEVVKELPSNSGQANRFPGLPYANHGVSVSDDGMIAQLQDQEREDNILIRLSSRSGEVVAEFTFDHPYSLPLSGPQLSPDGQSVAFAINTDVDGKRIDRLVACQARSNPACVWFDYLRDPAWDRGGLLYGIEDGKQFFVTTGPINYADPAANRVAPFGPSDLNDAGNLSLAPDNKTVLFAAGIGLQNIYAYNLDSGDIRQLTSGGNGQRFPRTDGSSLFYIQDCCASESGGYVAAGPVLHQIPLRLDQTTDSPFNQYAVRADEGPVSVSAAFGLVPTS
jgi:hypothetical protein